MIVKIRKWELSDAKDLALTLSNKEIQNNLRDGLPYPYTEQDGKDYISAMLSANENETFAFAVTADNKVIGSIGVFRQENIHKRTAELGYRVLEKAGFQYEGTLRSNAVKNGKVIDMKMYSLLKREA